MQPPATLVFIIWLDPDHTGNLNHITQSITATLVLLVVMNTAVVSPIEITMLHQFSFGAQSFVANFLKFQLLQNLTLLPELMVCSMSYTILRPRMQGSICNTNVIVFSTKSIKISQIFQETPKKSILGDIFEDNYFYCILFSWNRPCSARP